VWWHAVVRHPSNGDNEMNVLQRCVILETNNYMPYHEAVLTVTLHVCFLLPWGQVVGNDLKGMQVKVLNSVGGSYID
jgi:hypothetical protein